MKPRDWIQRWEDNRTPFHLDIVNPWLKRFHEQITGGTGCRVLLPLCGKSLDLVWLMEQGHDVVGVDVSRRALETLYKENNLTGEHERAGPFHVYRHPRLVTYAGDFFKLEPGRTGLFQLIYDRAALIALPPTEWAHYVRHLHTFLQPGGRIFLITLEYDQVAMDGPPYSITPEQVHELFADHLDVEPLATENLQDHPFKDTLPWLKESAFLLQSR